MDACDQIVLILEVYEISMGFEWTVQSRVTVQSAGQHREIDGERGGRKEWNLTSLVA